jgi:hypothetical protein
MVKLLKVIPSDVKNKKYSAYFQLDNGKEKKINFGQAGARDFTLINKKDSKFYIDNKDDREKVKTAYRARHAKDPINNPLTPASLSWHILWDLPSFPGSIKKFKNKFKL